MKKLTNQEIEQLFAFTKKHLVEHYDVQVELVDHLANAIEAQWNENPNISFEDALQTEFKKFGIFGFTGLVEQKQNELQKHYNKMLWNEVLKFVSIPKVILTTVLYIGIFFFLKKTGSLGETVLLSLLVLSFFYIAIDGFRFTFKIKREQKRKKRSWLIQSVAQTLFSLPIIGFSGAYFNMFLRIFETKNGLSILGMHFLILFVLIDFITIYVFFSVIKPRLLQSIKETEQKFQLV